MSSVLPLRVEPRSDFLAAADDWSRALRLPALWMNLALEDLRDRYRRTVLGIMWVVISFALFVAVKVLVFGQMSAASNREFAVFVTLGFGAWTFISSMVADACNAYLHSRAWILGTSVPYPVYLLQATARNWMVFLLILLVVAASLFWKPTPWTAAALFAPVGLLAYFATSLWLAALLAPLCARFHDLYHTVQTGMRLLFFVTPILWMPGKSGMLAELAQVNPITHYLAIVRDPLLYNHVPLDSWRVVLAINAVGVVVGAVTYASTRRKIAFWV
jgi:ABC-type polysaccharide/polyol phosphate export permease